MIEIQIIYHSRFAVIGLPEIQLWFSSCPWAPYFCRPNGSFSSQFVTWNLHRNYWSVRNRYFQKISIRISSSNLSYAWLPFCCRLYSYNKVESKVGWKVVFSKWYPRWCYYRHHTIYWIYSTISWTWSLDLIEFSDLSLNDSIRVPWEIHSIMKSITSSAKRMVPNENTGTFPFLKSMDKALLTSV